MGRGRGMNTVEEIEDDDTEIEEEYPHCLECGRELEKPVKREEDAFHPECAPDAPYTSWFGPADQRGEVNKKDAFEIFRRLDAMAEELAFYMASDRFEDCAVRLPDGSHMPAREWASRPETRALAGLPPLESCGRVDPSAPGVCWGGMSDPSGSGIDPLTAKRYDNVEALAAAMTEKVCEKQIEPGEMTVMLADGTYVDAHAWGRSRETRALVGLWPLESCGRVDPSAPGVCWSGQVDASGSGIDPVTATRYDTVEDLARETVNDVVEKKRVRPGERTLMLPDGTLVDACAWAQSDEARGIVGLWSLESRGRVDPAAPGVCWSGKPDPSGTGIDPRTAERHDDVEALAKTATRLVYNDWIGPDDVSLMLPDGTYVDAFEWAQRKDTRALAGCIEIYNNIELAEAFECRGCGVRTQFTTERHVLGRVGEDAKVATAWTCDACGEINTIFTTVPIVEDEGTLGPPRPVVGGGVADGSGSGATGAQPAGASGSAGTWSMPPLSGPGLPAVEAEVTGLESAIGYAAALASYASSTVEQLAGLVPTGETTALSCDAAYVQLSAHGVSGEPLKQVGLVQDGTVAAMHGVHRAIAAVEATSGLAQQLQHELERQRGVADAYGAAPDAGDRAFLVGE
jgi:hypothetical protein